MHREILLACLPLVLGMFACTALMCLLVRVSRARWRLAHVRKLHEDEVGGVQSLALVLTFPLFLMVMMTLVQLSQITTAKLQVEYAAFAAARSAIVWIPANLGPGEEENRISSLTYLGEQEAAGKMYSVYRVQPGSGKYNKIQLAAAMAMMPAAPGRSVGENQNHGGNLALGTLQKAYAAISPASLNNPRIGARLANKLSYSLNNTWIDIEVHHKEDEPPLMQHDIGPDRFEFTPNEIGWQDQLYVTVVHDFALLPGPGRILGQRGTSYSRASSSSSSSSSSGNEIISGSGGNYSSSYQQTPVYNYSADATADRIRRPKGVYVYTISANCRLTNEGEKPVLPYVQQLDGRPAFYEADATTPVSASTTDALPATSSVLVP